MSYFDELRNPDSPKVKAALERGCPVCERHAGEPCVSVVNPDTPLFEVCGVYSHMVRADGLPYDFKGGKKWAS